MQISILSRSSVLARIQATLVGQALQRVHPSLQVRYALKDAAGDVDKVSPLTSLSKGSFTEDLTKALREGEVDCVVHSWKDMPLDLTEGTSIAATLPRADMRDVILFHRERIAAKPKRVVVLSSSPRRGFNVGAFVEQSLPYRPEQVEFVPVRGNIPTRIRKLIHGEEGKEPATAVIIAKAALDRILMVCDPQYAPAAQEVRELLSQTEVQILPLSINPCAPAQGAVAVEIRSDRQELRELFAAINCQDTFDCCVAERKTLARYGGGCHQKIGAAEFIRPFGRVAILRGETNEGVLLDQVTLQRWADAPPEAACGCCWPHDAADHELIGSERIEVPGAAQQLSQLLDGETGLYVSKCSALPHGLVVPHGTVVWAAGVNTWQALAGRGVWVHGCSDRLGEREDERLQELFPKIKRWIKVTHEAAANRSSDVFHQVLGTYRMEFNIPETLSRFTHFFWSSSTECHAVLSRFPELRTRTHACGVGVSYTEIRKVLGQGTPLWPVVNGECWIQEIRG